MHFSSVVASFLSLFSVCLNATTNCYNAYDCLSETYLSGTINCYGFNSCRQIDEMVPSPASCYGSYSCYGIQSITIESSSGMRCYGLYSCAQIYDAISMNVDYAAVTCSGELSCYNNKVIVSDPDYSTTMYCEGSLSCAESTMEYVSGMRAYGYLSLYNSIVTMPDGGYYALYGVDIAMNAVFICGQGYTCEIKCYSHACTNITIICDNCTSIDVTCNYEFKSDACPDGLELPSYVDMNTLKPNLLEYNDYIDSFSTYEKSYYQCSESLNDATNCDGYQDCSSERANGSKYILEDNINNNLCCTAYESCVKYSPIKPNSLTRMNNSDIRCDGCDACRDNSNITTINGNLYFTAENIGLFQVYIKYISGSKYISDIHCSAIYSCINSTIHSFNNLYCIGRSSCWWNKILNGKNIFIYGIYTGKWVTVSNLLENGTLHCAGYQSCYASSIGSNIYNVYASGYEAMAESNISGIDNNIIGAGYEALYMSNIYDVGNELIGIGELCMSETSIKNVTKVTCDGQQACYQATMNSVSQVNCIGDQSCQSVIMTNIYDNITAYGNDSLIDATIISGIPTDNNNNNNGNNNELFISIYHDNVDGDIHIYCNASVTCYIDCQSEGACMNIRLHCENINCYVNCDENNEVRCPAFGDYYIWDKVTTTTTTMTPIETTANTYTTKTAANTVTTSIVTTSLGSLVNSSEGNGVSETTENINNDEDSSDDDNDNESSSNSNASSNSDSSNDNSLNMNVVFICICVILLAAMIIIAYYFLSKQKYNENNETKFKIYNNNNNENDEKISNLNKLIEEGNNNNNTKNDNDNNNNNSDNNDDLASNHSMNDDENDNDNDNEKVVEIQHIEPPMKPQRSSSYNTKGYISVGI